MSLGVGVIGAGVVGRLRAGVVAAAPGCRLVGVADPDLEAARAAAGGAQVYTDHDQLLADPGVGAVVVCTPTPLHRDMVEQALRAGKHVLCEKPLAPTTEDCRSLVQEARARGLVLAVGFNHRYYPCIKQLKNEIRLRLGRIHHVRALCGHQGLSEFRADWNYRGELSGGGVMMDLGVHLTDLVAHLFGPIKTVYGTSSNALWEVPGSEDHATAQLTTVRGVPVSYHASWGEWKGYRLVLEVYGDRGIARAFYAPMLNLWVARGRGRPRPVWNLHPWVNVREKIWGWETTARLAFQEEWTDFLGALKGNWGELASGQAGLGAVAVAHALYASTKSGLPVEVAGLESPGDR